MSFESLSKRAAGRRRYNSRRQFEAERRRALVVELLGRLGGSHGVQARIARVLGVSEATISRDIKILNKEWRRRHSL